MARFDVVEARRYPDMERRMVEMMSSVRWWIVDLRI
jgi:hypothetical protein